MCKAFSLQESNDETYAKMGRVMKRQQDEVMVGSNQEGVDKVKYILL